MDGKTCTKCATFKMLTEFDKRSEGVNRFASHCKECRKKYRQEQYANDPEKFKERWRKSGLKKRQTTKYHLNRKQYLQANKQSIAAQKATYRSLNRDRFRQWAQSDRDNLKDSYIRSLLVKTPNAESPPLSLIALYRENLKITRFIKNQGEFA